MMDFVAVCLIYKI